MSPEEIKTLLTSIGAVITACTAIFMVFYKGKELKNLHENILSKRLQSSINYDDNFFRNINKKSYSKNVKDAAACELVGNENVDAFLVNLLLEFHENKLIDLNEMMFLFNGGYKLGYLRYEKNRDIQECFRFHFSKKNNKIYYLSHIEEIEKSKKWAKNLFFISFIILMSYSVFFVYLVSISTTVFNLLFPLIFGIITFMLALFFPRLSLAIDQTDTFLVKFYAAKERYNKLKDEERKKQLEENSKSSVTNFSVYTRSKY